MYIDPVAIHSRKRRCRIGTQQPRPPRHSADDCGHRSRASTFHDPLRRAQCVLSAHIGDDDHHDCPVSRSAACALDERKSGTAAPHRSRSDPAWVRQPMRLMQHTDLAMERHGRLAPRRRRKTQHTDVQRWCAKGASATHTDDVKAVFYLQDSDNTHSVLLKVRRTSLDATAYTETYAPISR